MDRICAAAVAGVLVVFAGVAVGADDHPFVPGRLLVKFRDGVGEAVAAHAAATVRARVAGHIDGANVHVLDLGVPQSEAAAARALRARPDVEFVEPDWIYEPAATPNDPMFVSQWELTSIRAPLAWDYTVGSSAVKIAILDSGVSPTHPDLAPNLLSGWNVLTGQATTLDVLGHGSGVAGVAAAASNNAIGVAGVAWNCRILPIKITNDTSLTTTASAIANALNWAQSAGARVANCSYGASTSSTVAAAAQNYMNWGGVVTMAIGNSALQMGDPDNPYVLTVGGSTQTDTRSSFSNYGAIMDLIAPGSVTTTNNAGGYGGASGTSYAAPSVAGVAALVLSANPGLSGPQVMNVITQSCDDLGTPGRDVYYGWGRLNAVRAVQLALSTPGQNDSTRPQVVITSPANAAVVSGTVTVAVSATDNVAIQSVSLSAGGQYVGQDAVPPYGFWIDTTLLPDGPTSVVATATDPSGNRGTATITLNISNLPPPPPGPTLQTLPGSSEQVDSQSPIVRITAPLNGAAVNGTLTVSVDATDDFGVVRTDLYLDGQYSMSSSLAPFTMRLTNSQVSNGSHTIVVRAFDAAGNVGSSAPVTFTK